MKYRIFPKKSVVMAQLKERLGTYEEALHAAQKRDKALSESLLFVAQEDKRAAAQALKKAEGDFLAFVNLVELFESHAPEEIATEYEDNQ